MAPDLPRHGDRASKFPQPRSLKHEDYETVAFYNQPGRAFYLTLRYSRAE